MHGKLTKVDLVGRPAVNALFNQKEEDARKFNGTEPAQQREAFLPQFATILQGLGYNEMEATQLAGTFLPDILTCDYTSPAGYPNGRKLPDDVSDACLLFLTHGKITTDRVGPHTDYLREFPSLGPPHSGRR